MGAVYTLQGEGWWSGWIARDFLFGPYVMDLYLSIICGFTDPAISGIAMLSSKSGTLVGSIHTDV